MVILENIDIDIDMAILQNIDIDKISNRFKFGISNRASRPALTWCLDALELAAYICVCSTVAEIVQAANIQCRFWSRCWEVGKYSSPHCGPHY